jgi:hypothetical protein
MAANTIAERIRLMVMARVILVSLGWCVQPLATAEVRRRIAVGDV